ncbi:MAG: cytochrome c nitrite reductase small subunit [Armatimonadetes bacterium]|nr:cytochrome c nitrite reductase small subunit [Armatimonadota bacterium]
MFAGLGGYTFYYASGHSYLSNDPRACVNCHIMRPQYDAWQNSSHHTVAACNDCHTPHSLVPKYRVKASNGFRHSAYFTLGNFREPIRITPGNLRVVEENCKRCHGHLTAAIQGQHGENLSCSGCHRRVGHRW